MKQLAASFVVFFLANPVGTGAAIEQLLTPSVIHCCTACFLAPNCKGVLYNETGFACELLETQDLFPFWTMTRGPGDWYQCTNLDESPVNVALDYKEVEQSTTWEDLNWLLPAERAVDGDKSGHLSRTSSCSHTARNDSAPWFRLVLPDTYNIARIVVTNRQDCCRHRMTDFNVTLDGDFCNYYAAAASAVPDDVEMSCVGGPRRATTLEITTESEYIVICEIEIYED